MLGLPSQSFGIRADTSTVGARVVLGSSNLFDSTVIFRQFVLGEAVGLCRLGPPILVHCLGDVFC